jgi:cytochrome c-type biogenesis protein CcmH
LVTKLRQAVEDRPDDLQGHVLLTRSEAALGNYAAAWKAQQRVIALRGDAASARDFTDLADMMVLSANGYVSPEAQGALEIALGKDPQNGVARYYGGLMMAQTGRPDVAFRMWDALLRESPADAPWVAPIRDQMEDMAYLAGQSRYQLPELAAADAPGPSQDDIEAAAALKPEERMEMIQGMVAQLSDRLATDGGSAEEWARLITALGVLGDDERATAIWTEAQSVFANDASAMALLDAAAAQAGLK